MMWSRAFVYAPEGNGMTERFIRTFKEQRIWERAFQAIEDLYSDL